MQKVTGRKGPKQTRAQRWVEIVRLARSKLPKAQIAREVGCCRQTVYNVLERAVGLPATQAPVPRRPGPPPGSCSVPRRLRRRLIRWRLRCGRGARYCRAKLRLTLAASTIDRIWRRADLLESKPHRVRHKTRWIPPRPSAPGHLQVDVKYLPGGRFEYTAIDVYTRVVWAVIREQLDSATAANFLHSVLAQAPFPVHTVQTDNGSEFALDFAQFLRERGITHQRNAPRCAWQNGVVERFHRTIGEECYLSLADDLGNYSTAALNRHICRWLAFYNNRRLHSSLGYRPPVFALLSFLNQVST
jgi:transposase InsO family protein